MLELDQHFLKDETVIKQAIFALHISSDDIILEIGPGKGQITEDLAKKANNIIAVELDQGFKPFLDKLPKNVKTIYGNALEEMKFIKFTKLVSNIPFSISEPLLKELIKSDCDIAVLFVSRSFYENLNKDSKWAIITPVFFDIIKLMDVPRKSFEPKPKVDSILIKLKRRTEELKPIEQLIKELVLQDDKKLKNALMYALQRVKKLTKKESKAIISELNIENLLEKNTDVLSNEQFNTLYSILSSRYVV